MAGRTVTWYLANLEHCSLDQLCVAMQIAHDRIMGSLLGSTASVRAERLQQRVQEEARWRGYQIRRPYQGAPYQAELIP